ncbi:hypothetical protein B0H34DRAFT_732883 [Crassisporium funariophilum]|nr:hypothetical protein B0H34DRAFT_732883 [Crassisporium funariophilum]
MKLSNSSQLASSPLNRVPDATEQDPVRVFPRTLTRFKGCLSLHGGVGSQVDIVRTSGGAGAW